MGNINVGYELVEVSPEMREKFKKYGLEIIRLVEDLSPTEKLLLILMLKKALEDSMGLVESMEITFNEMQPGVGES